MRPSTTPAAREFATTNVSAKAKFRVLIGGLFHETHTFLDGTTELNDFQVRAGNELFAAHGDASPLGGVLELAGEFGWEMVPTVDYRAQPGATVADAVIERFWQHLVEYTAPALHSGVDAIYLVLHGAMTSASIADVEGEMLERLRRLPGAESLPVFGVFDLHANFTQRMATLANCLVGYRENPHIDAREAACIAARLLQRCLCTGEKPRMFWQHPPLMWPPTGTGTAGNPMKTLEGMARRMEEAHASIWAVSVVAGFSFADTPDTGVSFVVSGTDNGLSEILLQELTDQAWAIREQGNATEPPVDEVLEGICFRGNPPPPGLTVLVEPADNIGGGAPGDCTGLLRALLAHEIANAAVSIADRQAVAQLQGMTPGDRVRLAIGGRGSRLDPGPVELDVELVRAGDGRFKLEDEQSHLASMSGSYFDMGPCAVVRASAPAKPHHSVTILLTSTKTPPFDLAQWRSQGLEPTQFSVIGVKAAVAHRRAYDRIATRMIWVDTPGPCSSNLRSLPFQKVKRPVFPLDE